MNVHTISLSSTTCTNMESWHINAFMKSYALDTYRKNKHKLEFLSDFPLLDTSFTIFIGLTCICIYHLDAYHTGRCRYTYVDRCKDMSNKHMNTLSGSVPVLRCKPSITRFSFKFRQYLNKSKKGSEIRRDCLGFGKVLYTHLES